MTLVISFFQLYMVLFFISPNNDGLFSEFDGYQKMGEVEIYNPNNLYSEYVRAYILYAVEGELQQLKRLLTETLIKDTTRLDVLQEVGKACYYMRDYEGAFLYYKKFIDAREAYSLDIFNSENAKIGLVYSKMGKKEKSLKLFQAFKEYAESDKSIYKHLSLSVYYSVMDETDLAIEHLKLFAKEDNYFYWTILFLEIDPLVDNIKDDPEFTKILHDIEFKFWNNHKQIKTSLEEKGLL